MREAVLGVIALFAPRAVARRLAAIASQRELTTNTQLRDSGPARIAQFEEELLPTIIESARAFRRSIVGAGFFIASALVAAWFMIAVAYIQLPHWLITTCSLASVGFLSWATLGRLGWGERTWGGRSVFEQLDEGLFRSLYWLGTFLGGLAIAASQRTTVPPGAAAVSTFAFSRLHGASALAFVVAVVALASVLAAARRRADWVQAIATIALVWITFEYTMLTDRLLQIQTDPAVEFELATDRSVIVAANHGPYRVVRVVVNSGNAIVAGPPADQIVLQLSPGHDVPGENVPAWWTIGVLESGTVQRRPLQDLVDNALRGLEMMETARRRGQLRGIPRGSRPQFFVFLTISLSYAREFDNRIYTKSKTVWVARDPSGNALLWDIARYPLPLVQEVAKTLERRRDREPR